MANCFLNAYHMFLSVIFEYDTVKTVRLRSKKIGVFYRLVQLLIVSYVVGYAIIYRRGYQLLSDARGTTTTKLKGSVFTNFSEPAYLRSRIWDVADLVVPPQEQSAFFVMTNVIVTDGQRQGRCAEDPRFDIPHTNPVLCRFDSDCPAGEPVVNGNGVRTGRCIDSHFDNGTRTRVCEIFAWCPVENDTLPLGPHKAALLGTKDLTVLLKNSVFFPLYPQHRFKNIRNTTKTDYLRSCRFNSETDPLCPVFRLGTIVDEAGADYESMAVNGGVISIEIRWDCNLDFAASWCLPSYHFRRIDDPHARLGIGYNFRFSDLYRSENSSAADSFERRKLTKAIGILFFIRIEGRAGKYNSVPLLLNLGSGLALLAIATITCDSIILYIHKRRQFYREKKYELVRDQDAYRYADMSFDNSTPADSRRPSAAGGAQLNGDDSVASN